MDRVLSFKGPAQSHESAHIAAWLQPVDILLSVDVADRSHALQVAAAAYNCALGLDPALVFRALWRREQAGSTALGDAFAIPHACIKGIARPAVLFIRTRRAIGFDAPDGAPVSQLLTIIVPDEGARDDYLRLLALVVQLFSDRAFRTQLNGANDVEVAKNVFRSGIHRVVPAFSF